MPVMSFITPNIQEQYLVKWKEYPETEATWEPIENLNDVIEKVAEFNQKEAQKKKSKRLINIYSCDSMTSNKCFLSHYSISVLDQIIGCGERNGHKYFLVRFRGDRQNEMIDWETAKQYSLDVMEFFGSRLVWKSIDTIVDPENDDNLYESNEPTFDQEEDQNMPSTSQNNRFTRQINPLPNDIEYDSD